jgi:hypothetical protein
MLTPPKSERSLVEHLLETLRALPDVNGVQVVREASAAKRASHARIDAVIDLRIAGKSLQLMIEANKSLYPRDARNAFWVWTTKNALAQPAEDERGPERVPMLIATSISPVTSIVAGVCLYRRRVLISTSTSRPPRPWRRSSDPCIPAAERKSCSHC